MAPTAAQISVALAALRTQATGWAERATTTAGLATEVTGYKYTELEAGLFDGFIEEYNKIIDLVETRLKEGELALKEMARTLNTVADVYEQEDLAREHATRNLY
ncbi:hypothetical protein NBRGN_112_00880 [Nocardia brasiliensis NBRC 14402]|uniref:hypothetical protein n=1 Tax=Nocardia brasiliensis TaxID=37326 RepID=UPI00045C8EBA|nr:hypothetical protein [Nocardia brasiliensis]GAJ86873.1 hypothetical protein NBRGN_112_00880 [Nocardia brasiliensis NBRC 14402]SUB11465.1 Uncharacterised protein [Nocardia brasiliensis]